MTEMETDRGANGAETGTEKAVKPLSPAAKRAIVEAEARHKAAPHAPKESGGPDGPEPTRYGDWERRGIASDF